VWERKDKELQHERRVKESDIENVECVISSGGQKRGSFIPESPILFYNIKWSEKYKGVRRGGVGFKSHTKITSKCNEVYNTRNRVG
jgi:hypothetical protein